MALVIQVFVNSNTNSDHICSALFGVRKSYYVYKLAESLCAEESSIRSAIERWMESFAVDKGHMIYSVLECSFWKVVLDHLVSDGNLIVDPVNVKNNVDKIMEDWTKKKVVPYNILDSWQHQYLPLEYVDDKAFSRVMDIVSYENLVCMVKDLPEDKTAGLSGITNEL
ncbi:hypothetical protein G9A89_019136 [Geosiphon pyriformis]|nr:hypothetical protein G9A89_019136 [Geosiphon pyriformis]